MCRKRSRQPFTTIVGKLLQRHNGFNSSIAFFDGAKTYGLLNLTDWHFANSELASVDGFIPSQGQTFSIFGDQFDSITGEFQSLSLPTFNGLTFAMSQNRNSVNLQVVESIGDFNHDGFVNGSDYVVWRTVVAQKAYSLLIYDTSKR